jgi:YidC/Oxa1 family membrane protein insertase
LAEKEAQKAKDTRKKKGPSMMERAIEIRNEQGAEMPKPGSQVKKSDEAEDNDDDGEEEVKLTKAQIKEQNRQKLNEARRRYAEKYGDEYTDE